MIKLEAFIKIPIQKSIIERKIYGCRKHSLIMERHPIDEFCSFCGSKLENFVLELEQNKWLGEILGEELEDALCHWFNDGQMYLFSNSRNCNSSVDTDFVKFTVLTTELIEQKKSNFEAHYQHIIKMLEKVTGQEIKIEFGFLND